MVRHKKSIESSNHHSILWSSAYYSNTAYFEQQQRPFTHQPLHPLPPPLTADYFINTLKQPPHLYVAYWLHKNNNIPLLCTPIIHPPTLARANHTKTLQIHIIQPLDHCKSIAHRPNNIPPQISIDRGCTTLHKSGPSLFFDGNIFKNNNHGTRYMLSPHRFNRVALGNYCCLISARVEFSKAWVQTLQFVRTDISMKTITYATSKTMNNQRMRRHKTTTPGFVANSGLDP